jgi:RNA polymerase-interacting CarD/CdnL/TRCF family regulator
VKFAGGAGTFQKANCAASRRKRPSGECSAVSAAKGASGNSTVAQASTYTTGDWVVHLQHGAGRIESLEKKGIGEKSKTYCKIKAHDITIWLPADKMNDEWLRPLASLQDIQRALEVLKKPPQPMSDNLNSRKGRIKKTDANDEPVVIAELLRDLWALKKEKKMLSQAEEAALRRFTGCFLAEWSVGLDVPIEEARQEFERLLQMGREQRVA